MLDSDGFMIAEMTEKDYMNLTLEEKILCGYFKVTPDSSVTASSDQHHKKVV